MKPTSKPKRTAEQRAEEEAVRRQHTANPVSQRPAGTINRQSFAAILSLVARFKALRESQGLTLAEATNELAFISTGAFGKPIAKQNGAPLRLTVPWKYGFKCAKSIVKIDFVA